MKMTKEEAIAQIEKLKSYCEYMKDSDENGAYVFDLDVQALDFVLSALTQPNEPLTFEERREMGRKPVWLDDEKTFGILQFRDDNNVDAVFLDPSGRICVKSVIGKKIYRRPPEEEV